jgi:hypothetical protein
LHSDLIILCNSLSSPFSAVIQSLQ